MGELDPDWSFRGKWRREVADLGFTQVPNALLIYATRLNLKPTEFYILVNLESYRWDGKKRPFPSLETLSSRVGMTTKTVSRNITSLIEKDCIDRIKRKGVSNEYDFYPLNIKLLGLIKSDGNRVLKGHPRGSPKDINRPAPETLVSPKEYPRKNTQRIRPPTPNYKNPGILRIDEVIKNRGYISYEDK